MNRRIISIAVSLLLSSNALGGVNFNGASSSGPLFNAGTCGDRFLREDQPMTFSCWLYFRSVGVSVNATLLERAAGVSIATLGTNAIRFRVIGATSLTRASSNSVLAANTWYHILVTHDGSTTAANCHIYVNGVEVTYATTTNGATLDDNSAGSIIIGNVSSGARTVDGIMDEVRIFNRIVSDAERKTLGSRVRVPITDGAGPYYTMDDTIVGNVATTAFDRSGNGCNATGSNSPISAASNWISYP